jgi:hypothetical protein
MRLTHLLRPNVTRPDFTALGVLDTPPASDVDAFSVMMDTEDSDVASEVAFGSEEGAITRSTLNSSNVTRRDDPEYQVRILERPQLDDAVSSGGEHADDTFSISVESLTPEESRDWESAPSRRARAMSSPSCSPSRPGRRSTLRIVNPQVLAQNHLPFWQYVFA